MRISKQAQDIYFASLIMSEGTPSMVWQLITGPKPR